MSPMVCSHLHESFGAVAGWPRELAALAAGLWEDRQLPIATVYRVFLAAQ